MDSIILANQIRLSYLELAVVVLEYVAYGILDEYFEVLYIE